MKNKAIVIAISFVSFGIIMFSTVTAHAYHLGWCSLQLRVFEGGDRFYQLRFNLLDDQDSFLNDVAAINVTLKDPNGSDVTMEPIDSDDPFIFDAGGQFDSNTSCWIYGAPRIYSEFYTIVDLSDPPVFGVYTLQVEIDDETLEKEISFEYLLELPIIPSKTFQIHNDPLGNIYWMWEIPQQILALSASYSMSYRAVIWGKKNGQEVGYVFPKVPIHMGFCYIPSSAYQHLINEGADEYIFRLHVRLDNNYSRSYSTDIVVNDLVSLAIKKKVGIEEAVYALQVVSGLR